MKQCTKFNERNPENKKTEVKIHRRDFNVLQLDMEVLVLMLPFEIVHIAV